MVDTRLFISETSGVVGTEVNLYDGVALNISYAIADIRFPEKRNTSFSKTITIPGTKTNNKLFEHIFEVDIEGGFNPNHKAYAIATADTVEVFNGVVQLLRINILQDNRIEYEIALKGKTGDLFQSMGDRYLTDLDLSTYNHLPSKAVQAASWGATIGEGYVYPIIDNGLQDVTAVIPVFDSADMAPAIYAKTIVDQIFSENSFSYTSDFFNTDFFKRLIVYSNRPFPGLSVTFSGALRWFANAGSGIETAFQFKLRHFRAAEGIIDHIVITNLVFPDGASPTITTNYSKTIIVHSGDTVALEIDHFTGEVVVDTGTTFLGTYAATDIISNSNFSVSKTGGTQTISIPGLTIITFDTEVSDPGNTFSTLASHHFVPVIPFKHTMAPNVKQRDFLLSIIKAFNLYVWENVDLPNNLYIEPRDDFYLSGSVFDWTAKLDRSKQLQLVPMGELDFKTFIFKYKDDEDFYNRKYKGDHAITYGTKILDVDNDFIIPTNTIELIFAPSPMVSYPNTIMVFPSIVKDALNNQDDYYGGEIRLLYYGGLKTGGWIHRDGTGDTSYSTYPYCGHLDDPYASTLDILFDSPKEVYYVMDPTTYTDNNLFNAYYKKMMDEITDPDSKLVIGYFYLTPDDILKLSFRYLYQVDFHFLRLNKIYEYDPKRRVTKCEFIKVKEAVPFVPGHRQFTELNVSPLRHITAGILTGVQLDEEGVPVDAATLLAGNAVWVGGNIDIGEGESGGGGHRSGADTDVVNGGIAK